jgi:hypothetical protein
MFGCCCAIARIERLGFSRGRGLGLFGCAVALLLTHYLGFAILGALVIYCTLRLRGAARRGAVTSIVAGAVIVLATWGPFWWGQLHSYRPTLAWLHDDAPGGGGGAVSRTLARVAALPVRFFFDPVEQPGPLVFLGGALLLIPALLLRRSPALLMWYVLLWLMVAVVAIGDAARGTMALAMPRYTLAAGAAAVVLAAVIAASAPPRRWLRVVAPSALLAACALALPQAYVRYRPDFCTLAEYLDVDCHDDGAIVLYPTAREQWYAGLLEVALIHYAPHLQRPTVLLQCPADDDLERQLAPDGVIDVVSGSLPAEQILPGCHVLTEIYFPLIGSCARVRLPAPSVMSPPSKRSTLLAPRASR